MEREGKREVKLLSGNGLQKGKEERCDVSDLSLVLVWNDNLVAGSGKFRQVHSLGR
jgi:hypothetical protein